MWNRGNAELIQQIGQLQLLHTGKMTAVERVSLRFSGWCSAFTHSGQVFQLSDLYCFILLIPQILLTMTLMDGMTKGCKKPRSTGFFHLMH